MRDQIVPLKESGYEVSWERRIILLALILALVSFAGCVTLSVLEIVSSPQIPRFSPKKPQTASQVQPTITPGIHPLVLLPDEISGFALNARHAVPGYETYMAEAIYQPQQEELSRVVSLNAYAKITYFERAWDAEKAIQENLTERYPEEHKVIDLNGQQAFSGLEQTKKSFFIGWSAGNYAIEIDVSFTGAVPGSKDKSLEETGTKVALEVQKVSSKALAKK